MLFNSPVFVFVFLPLVLAGFGLLGRVSAGRFSIAWLWLCSLVFYGWWDYRYLALLLGSIAVNYCFGLMIHRRRAGRGRRVFLVLGVVFNLGLLGVFKYLDFALNSLNAVSGLEFPLPHIVLPLAISFFTFQQIAYLVDCHASKVSDFNLLNYALFVSFFPQLIAGPIVHHGQVLPQFRSPGLKKWDANNFSLGWFLFVLGLSKKVLLADQLSPYVQGGYTATAMLDFGGAWMLSFAYSMQLFLDFCGYSEMAIGLALLFNIRIPENFDNPYRALTIQAFWRRWHITLSQFLRDYLFIPLGGSRGREARIARNLLLTFAIGGIWHGAGWNFLLWGVLHGLALVLCRWWGLSGRRMPLGMGWLTTFLFVNFCWVFFRASTFGDAWRVLSAMTGFGMAGGGSSAPSIMAWASDGFFLGLLLISVVVSFWAPSTRKLLETRPGILHGLLAVVLFVACVMRLQDHSEFIYFRF